MEVDFVSCAVGYCIVRDPAPSAVADINAVSDAAGYGVAGDAVAAAFKQQAMPGAIVDDIFINITGIGKEHQATVVEVITAYQRSIPLEYHVSVFEY